MTYFRNLLFSRVLMALLFVPAFIVGCKKDSKDDKDSGGTVTAFDGKYKGSFEMGGMEAGTWECTITNGAINGSMTQMGTSRNFTSTIKSNGSFAFEVTGIDGSKVKVQAMVVGTTVSGTWTSEGESGILYGEKISDGGSNPGDSFDGSYQGTASEGSTVVGTWQMTVSDGKANGTFVQAGASYSFSGTVQSTGTLNFSVSPEPGYTVVASLKIEGTSVSGTWADSEGDSGTISGQKL